MTKSQLRFVTGHSEIDQEHQRFFDELDALKQSCRDPGDRAKVIESIVHLQEHALNHYAHDERYMARLGCSSHPENYEDHRAFALRLEGWRFLLSTSAAPTSLAEEVHREATEWIESHIADNECKLRASRFFELAVAG